MENAGNVKMDVVNVTVGGRRGCTGELLKRVCRLMPCNGHTIIPLS